MFGPTSSWSGSKKHSRYTGQKAGQFNTGSQLQSTYGHLYIVSHFLTEGRNWRTQIKPMWKWEQHVKYRTVSWTQDQSQSYVLSPPKKTHLFLNRVIKTHICLLFAFQIPGSSACLYVFESIKKHWYLTIYSVYLVGQKHDEQTKLTVHYTASQHYQENVFIEGSRPKYLEDLHTEAQEGLKILQQEGEHLI